MARKQIAFYPARAERAPGAVDLEAADELAAQSAGPDATAESGSGAGHRPGAPQVPDGQREVIMLRYILSMSITETAAAVGRTEGAVKQLQLRGLATLKNLLGRKTHPCRNGRMTRLTWSSPLSDPTIRRADVACEVAWRSRRDYN